MAKQPNKITPSVSKDPTTVSKSKTKRVSSRRVSQNTMFDDTDYVHEQLDRLTFALEAFREGDISVRLSKERNDKFADLAEAYNTMVEMIGGVSTEVSRISRVGGVEGNLGARADYQEASGVWRDLITNINVLIEAIAKPVLEVSRILNSIASGNLEDKFGLTVTGDFRSMADVINRTLGSLNIFAEQVTQVAREVGVEGKLGGQASVPNVSGTWKDLTDNVNLMASNLTIQVREIAQVTTSVANGDLSRKITEEGKGGEVLSLSQTLNKMVDSLNVFAGEVTRVAREVGTEGKLGGQADVPNVGGTWKDLTDNVNIMASNLTTQVRDIANVATAVAYGDLSQKITIDVKGEIADLKGTINKMVDSLNIFAAEVTRVAREVGTEGKLGGQANVPDVAGTWKDLTVNVNQMASNLTLQVREIANVTTSVANGDLSKTISEEGKGGEVLELSNTINQMVNSLNIFAKEVNRVAGEVGTEGRLGGQAQVPNVAGTWKDLTDNVNLMASNLTNQVREIANVATAVANGDLGQKITIDVKGEVEDLKNTINQMVDSLNTFSDEVTRVAREVGTEGLLGGQAEVPNVAGTWKNLTENVNLMASNLTSQVREIANVATAVAKGDLTQQITIEARGEIAELKDTINKMVDSLNIFSDEVTRVAKEVGTEGILGSTAKVPDVAGTWENLTDNVNLMANNLTKQVREIANVATAVAQGDLTQKVDIEAKGEIAELKDTINGMVDSLNVFSDEVTRVAREVGTEGILGGQAEVPNVAGSWLDLTNNVNTMASNLNSQVREIALVATAVANGDLSRKITIDVQGEIAELKQTINEMVDSLNIFAAEVTRLAQEVGTEGKLGGKAEVPNVRGAWKDLTDNVNIMAGNLTDQVREIAAVTTSVAEGDMSQKISINVKGEINDLKTTINQMVDSLNVFASEVTNVAREVGTEGILGGQAEVPNVGGAWKDLTDNVNQMADNLTNQVRDIAGVSTALAQGDFSRKIEVHVSGEVLELKDNINSMVDSFINIVKSANTIAKGDFSVEMPLRSENDQLGVALNTMTDNLQKISSENESEAWIKTGQSGLNDRMRGEQNLSTLSKNIISYLTKYLNGKLGVLYLTIVDEKKDEKYLNLTASYAYTHRKSLKSIFKFGEGLVGQAASEREPIIINEIPEDYVTISSALGGKVPKNIIVQPFTLEGEVVGIVEIGSFNSFTDNHIELLRLVSENIAIAMNSSQDREKMQTLLLDSQRQSEELLDQQQKLKSQSEELQSANEELESKTQDLELQKEEIQSARVDVERKATELELASKYKSEFLANMSHELRTPLNSLLILSRELSRNDKKNLTEEQVKDATIIYDGGRDLLNLINDILDLSKVEAGKMLIQPEELKIVDILSNLQNQFKPVAKDRNLIFKTIADSNAPSTITSDGQRLEQIIKNLLSNAFKFTSEGEVIIKVHIPNRKVRFREIELPHNEIIAFEVSDTGVGISEDKQLMIFEAFQQAEGGTSRQYGGTGLGLTISRELSRLLGGEIHLSSIEGKGSVFTIYIPIKLSPGKILKETSYDIAPSEVIQRKSIEKEVLKKSFLPDDRDDITEQDNSLLIIEDDIKFAGILQNIAQSSKYKTLITNEGKEGIELASKYQPKGIILDLNLPDIHGFKVLDNIKFNLRTRHIPVHVISAQENDIESLKKGAIGFISKPATKTDIINAITKLENINKSSMKKILIVEDNEKSRMAIEKLLKNKEIKISHAQTGKEAINKISNNNYDCVILDLRLPDISGFEVLNSLKSKNASRVIPVIIYTGKELSRNEVKELNQYTESIVIKGVSSPERLFDEVSLFLHSIESKLSQTQRKIMSELHDPDKILQGRKILLTDDDMRNTYALSKILTDEGMEVTMADNGQMALEKIQSEENIELVLMDIMMPVMDGYDAIAKIRLIKEYEQIPIIALTAKAMPEDKAKCLEAGANDYLTKPVEVEKLLSMMRVWLYETK